MSFNNNQITKFFSKCYSPFFATEVNSHPTLLNWSGAKINRELDGGTTIYVSDIQCYFLEPTTFFTDSKYFKIFYKQFHTAYAICY
jgi:hypothetical protein